VHDKQAACLAEGTKHEFEIERPQGSWIDYLGIDAAGNYFGRR
jgi:hypothetical protein